MKGGKEGKERPRAHPGGDNGSLLLRFDGRSPLSSRSLSVSPLPSSSRFLFLESSAEGVAGAFFFLRTGPGEPNGDPKTEPGPVPNASQFQENAKGA